MSERTAEPAVDASVDVAIVGAGISGLATARHLAGNGLSVAVLEARHRVGGRLDSVDGLDLGATWFWPNEPRIARLITELGIDVHEQHLAGDAVYQDDAGTRRLQGNPIDVPSGRFVGGADSLARRVAQTLPAGVVRLDTEVTRISFGAGGTVDIEAAGGLLTAGHLVVAAPPALVAERVVFSPGLPAELATLARSTPVWMGGITKVVIRYSEAFWRARGLSGSGISHVGPLREIHDMSGVGGVPAALFGFVPELTVGEPTVTERAVIEQLVTLFGADAAVPEAVHIRDWRAERHTSPGGVAELVAFERFGDRRYAEPAFEGRLHWASTETSNEFPGHIEGALAAAERAARAILAVGTPTASRQR